MSILVYLDSFKSLLNRSDADDSERSHSVTIKKHYYDCEAMQLSFDIMATFSKVKVKRSAMIRTSIQELYQLGEEMGVIKDGNVDPFKKSLMLNIALYDDAGSVSDEYHIDAVSVQGSGDKRLIPLKNTRCEMSESEDRMLKTLKLVYGLDSDGDAILHCMMVFASILNMEVQENLHVYNRSQVYNEQRRTSAQLLKFEGAGLKTA